MRKFFLLIIIAYFSWEYYAVNYGETTIKEAVQSQIITPLKTRFEKRESNRLSSDKFKYECDGRQYCEQMNPLSEANFFIKNCPNTQLDRDYDGKPCETDPRF
jgi:hypothetical protein